MVISNLDTLKYKLTAADQCQITDVLDQLLQLRRKWLIHHSLYVKFVAFEY